MLRTSVSEEAARNSEYQGEQSRFSIGHPFATWLTFFIVTVALAITVGLAKGTCSLCLTPNGTCESPAETCTT
jgi:hypothetical protein